MALPTSLGAREYGKFRETRHGEIAMGITNEDEASPISLNVTASGDTELIPAPGAGENIIVKGFHFSNEGGGVITVALKAGTGGEAKFPTCLAASGGNFDKNLIGRYWILPLNKALVVNLSGAGDVQVTVETEPGVEPAQEAVTLTDSITFAEAISKAFGRPGITDSQAIAEAIAKKPSKPLSDSVTFAESILITGDRSKALGDSLAIAEAVGNKVTLSLSDTVSLVASIAVTLIPG